MSAFGCPARHMPANWDPPAPGWSARFLEPGAVLIVGLFTVEGSAEIREAFVARLDAWFRAGDGPERVERAEYAARSGQRATITLAYWSNPASHAAWMGRDFDPWWHDAARLHESAALSLEIMRVPRDRMETIFGQDEHAGAVRVGTCPVFGPVREHLYWGSMRDRLPAAAKDPLASIFGHNPPSYDAGETRGRRLSVVVPQNLCIIRSGQNWAGCDEEELSLYDRNVRPSLHAGMRFLRDNPSESGCLDMRFANEVGVSGPLERAFGLGLFLSLAHLEAWAAHHPTHLAIFNAMIGLATERGDRLALRLWHEVFVLAAEGQRFEYLNCAGETGLLPYFESREVASSAL